MKNWIRKFGLSLATIACLFCASFGVVTLLPSNNTTAKAADVELAGEDYYVSGVGVRLVNDANGLGVRFHTRMSDEQYAELSGAYKTGTLIIPEIRYDGELTLEDLNNVDSQRPAHVDTTTLWYDSNKDGYMQSTAYIYNIPEVAYGARYIARSYVQYANGDIAYTPASPETSLSDIATTVLGSGLKEKYGAQVEPYVVETVAVKYVMSDGSTQTETVDYDSKLQGPTYDTDAYAAIATDQYGKTVDFATYKATLPVTINVALTALPKENVVVAQLIKDGYGATAPERAWQNGSTAAVVTEGIPDGYSSVLRLDWYQQSTSLWKVGGNPFYRSCYDQTDISGYEKVTFGLKLETSGDACIQIYPLHGSRTANGVINNEWIFVELVQTSANVWTLTVKDDAGNVIYTKDGVTRNNNGLNDVDSVASLVFSACKWDGASPSVMLQPCSSTDMTASVYMTEVLGYTERVYLPDGNALTVANSALIDWTWGINNNKVTSLEKVEGTAPTGFTTVTKVSSGSDWTSSSQSSGFLSTVDLTNYSEVWFAYKAENGKFTQTKPDWTDIATDGSWIYFHLIQTGETNDSGYILWDIEIIKNEAVWNTITDQHANGAVNNIQQLFDYHDGDNGRIVQYHNGSGTAEFYATEIRGILKDGATPPSSGETTEFNPEIPDNAIAVRHYPWRDDKYTTGKNELLTEGAPEGFTSVLKHTWDANRTAEYTYCFDTTLDITKFSDLYLATKMENGTHIYVKNSGGHYAGGGWLYVHYQQVSTGVWSVSFRAADGYSKDIAQTISATNIKTLIDGNLYGHASAAGMGTITYWTEILGVSDVQGERAIFSAVDGAVKTDDAVGAPAGFTSVFKYENFTKDGFAALDVTMYDTLRFGMIADRDFTFNAGYKYTMPDEDTERPTTSIMYNTSSYPQMYVVSLTNNNNGSWTVTMNVKRWVSAPASGGSSAQIPDTETFTATVTGNNLQTIMGTILTPNKGLILYVTEVRGTHTCAYNNTKSLGNGYLQDYCICGKAFGDAYAFEHGIPAETIMANDSIWRDNNYALSTPDQVAPAGFENIEMFDWNHNTTIVNGVPYGSTSKDFPLTCFDEADVSAYDQVWFAMKLVGGTGFYVRGGAKYMGTDWLYFHLVKVDGAWTLSLASPDGYVANNVQTGIVGNTLNNILKYHGSSDAEPWNSGAYPTKEDGDTTSDVRVYFTEILGIVSCEHTSGTEFVSNGDGTHNEVCVNCSEVITENIPCTGGTATCTEAAKCDYCNAAHGSALGHGETTWDWGVETCTVCGLEVSKAATVASSAVIESTNANLTISNNAAGVTAPAGFSSVTNLYSASGETWPSKILGAADFAGATLTACSEVWFAIAVTGGHFTNTADNWKNLDSDSALVWVKFHLVQTSSNVWSVSIYVDDELYNTFENRPGDTIYELIENNNNGLRLVLYQQTSNNVSNADVNIYATEVLGVFNTGISSYAVNVWDHIWNSYYFTGGGAAEGKYSDDMAAPAGFDMVSEYTCSTKDFAYKTGHFNASDISGYSDLWFAIKVVNKTEGGDAYVYLQGAPDNGYKGSEWVYVHYHQVSDGNWTKDYRTVDGYYSPATAHTGITGTKLTDIISYKSGINQGSYPTATTGNEYTGYFTNVIGVKKCTEHTGEAVSNGDGTHNLVCTACGTILTENVACTGGSATCTEAAKCTACGGAYGALADHVGEWSNEGVYECANCGEEFGEINENPAQQDVVLFTNATYAGKNASATGAFDATVATPATINLSELVKGLSIDGVSNVYLNGEAYAVSSFADGLLTIQVVPFDVYGEYTLTVTISVQGKDFEIEMPILVITDLITDNAGLLNLRKVLRGQDLTTATVTATLGDTEYRQHGGQGGIGTMNGTGYYKLGANITLSEITIGEYHTEDYSKQLTYVFGTPTVPFTGTFDGAGYVLNNYKAVKSAYNKPTIDGVATSVNLVQDVSMITASSAGTTLENEPSFFGYMNGVVKHVAFTNAQFGQYGNIVLTGTGVMEDVYVDVARLQSARYGGTTETLTAWVAPLAQRSLGDSLTMRNVVIDLMDAAFAESTATISTHYPSLIGQGIGAAENVAVYGFDTAWIAANGTTGNVHNGTDGSDKGIYVQYRAGNDSTDNSVVPLTAYMLDDELWKVVNGVPMLKKVNATEGSAPSATAVSAIAGTDNNVVTNNSSEYVIYWMSENGAFDAAQFIREYMTKSTGATLNVGLADPEDTGKKQIIVGTYAKYLEYVTAAGYTVELTAPNGNYGVYLIDKTFFVLAENEVGFEFAAEELCRRLFGYTELAENDFVYDSVSTVAIPAEFDYTSAVTFSHRAQAYTSEGRTNQDVFNFNNKAIYSYYQEMHNTFNYFDANSDLRLDAYTATKSTNDGSTNGGAQLCYLGGGVKATFDGMVDRVVAVIVAHALANKNLTTINFMIEDNIHYCGCDACVQVGNSSLTQLIFLNEVAKKVAANEDLIAQCRTINIEFFAYGGFANAPIISNMDNFTAMLSTLGISDYETATVDLASKVSYSYTPASVTVLKAEDNLRLQWTSHKANHAFELTHEANDHMYLALLGWLGSVKAENVDLFLYQATYRDYFMPLNTWKYQVEWYKTFNQLGIGSYVFNLGNVYNPANAQTSFAAFKAYIDSRAMTDVNVTYEQLKDEFFGENGYYGAAGSTMRTYFEELEAVMESLKQGGSNAPLSSTASWTINGTTSSGYIDGSLFVNDNEEDGYANKRQAFFNGYYGYDMVAVVFGGMKSSTSNIAPNAIFVKDNYGSQQATLEAWYTYCQTALGMVDANSKYAKRINVEMVFPEYAYLVLESTYKTTARWSSSKYSGIVTSTRGSSTVITKTYQEFYNNVKALGFVKPSEFYTYDFGTGVTLTTDHMGTVAQTGSIFKTSYGLYYSWYMNWGVTF